MKLSHGLINQKWSSQDILVNKTFLLSASKSPKHGFSSWWDIFQSTILREKKKCVRQTNSQLHKYKNKQK